ALRDHAERALLAAGGARGRRRAHAAIHHGSAHGVQARGAVVDRRGPRGASRASRGQLFDDMASGKARHQAGYKNVMSTRPLHIATGGMTLRQFLPVYRRLVMFSKNGPPTSFT